MGLSVDEAQKVATMVRDDKKADSQVLIDTHNRRAGKLQWLRQALCDTGNGNLGGKSIFSEEMQQALANRYGRCLLAWTRSDEKDGVIAED